MTQAKYVEYGTKLAENIGKMVAEKVAMDDHDNSAKVSLKESYGITFKEGQNTTNNAGAYTTLLGETLSQAAVQDIQDILGLVYHDKRLISSKGFRSVQLPRQTPTIAYEVAEGAVSQRFTEGIGSITVTAQKVVAATGITWEIEQAGLAGFNGYIMNEAKDAVKRKIGSDIVNGLVAGAGHTPLSGGISYAKIVDGVADIENSTYDNGVNYGFVPNALVLSPTAFQKLRKDSDIKEFFWRGTPFPLQGAAGAAGTSPLMLDNLEVIKTPLLTSAEGLLTVKGKNIMVWESEGETFEGHIPGRPYDKEVVFLASYVLGMVQPKAALAITA